MCEKLLKPIPMRNTHKTIRQLALAAVLSTFTLQSMAQDDAASIVKGGIDDANKLGDAYLSPLLKSFGAGLNGGWFNTAKPHGIGGFDITISANTPFAPSSDQTYDVSQLGLQKIRPTGPNTVSPTFFGKDKEGPEVGIFAKSPATNQDTMISRFNLPQGIGAHFIPVPTVQFNVGVGFGTEVAVRFFPTITMGSTTVGLFGFALKHDIKQWIPGVKTMPFDMSVMFGYTSVKSSFKIDALQNPGSDSVTYNPNPTADYASTQKLELNSSGWTTNLLISKKLGPITPYLGVGYQTSNSTLKMSGHYAIADVNPTFDPTKGYYKDPNTGIVNPNYNANNQNSHPMVVKTISDPVSIEEKNSGFRTTLGVRIKLAVITIHGDYTFANYNVASVGVGLNLQSIVPFKL